MNRLALLSVSAITTLALLTGCGSPSGEAPTPTPNEHRLPFASAVPVTQTETSTLVAQAQQRLETAVTTPEPLIFTLEKTVGATTLSSDTGQVFPDGSYAINGNENLIGPGYMCGANHREDTHCWTRTVLTSGGDCRTTMTLVGKTPTYSTQCDPTTTNISWDVAAPASRPTWKSFLDGLLNADPAALIDAEYFTSANPSLDRFTAAWTGMNPGTGKYEKTALTALTGSNQYRFSTTQYASESDYKSGVTPIGSNTLRVSVFDPNTVRMITPAQGHGTAGIYPIPHPTVQQTPR